jgi:hypothetical protein
MPLQAYPRSPRAGRREPITIQGRQVRNHLANPGRLQGDSGADDPAIELGCRTGRLRGGFRGRIPTARHAGSAASSVGVGVRRVGRAYFPRQSGPALARLSIGRQALNPSHVSSHPPHTSDPRGYGAAGAQRHANTRKQTDAGVEMVLLRFGGRVGPVRTLDWGDGVEED